MLSKSNFDVDALFKKVVTGDYKAFEEIFHHLYNSLCNYALKYVKDTTIAEEVVSDVFFKLWKNKSQINILSSFQHYIFRAVKNQSLDYLKNKNNQNLSIHEINFYVYDSYAESPEEEMSNQELDNKIERAIQTLPQQCKNIFVMSREQGLKYREIAEKLNISIKTVETQMGRALKALRSFLKNEIAAIFLLFFY
jgi:RNA polymerase sigma-70 factor, ECF subfamily